MSEPPQTPIATPLSEVVCAIEPTEPRTAAATLATPREDELSPRPSPDTGRPRVSTLAGEAPSSARTWVFTRLMVHSVDEISTIRQEWKADVELEMKWVLEVGEESRMALLRGGFWPGKDASPDNFLDFSRRTKDRDWGDSPQKGGAVGGGEP